MKFPLVWRSTFEKMKAAGGIKSYEVMMQEAADQQAADEAAQAQQSQP